MSARVPKTRNPYIPKQQTPVHSNILLQGLKTLREENILIDITVCIDHHKYNAHKVVLSACSDYFKAMFNTNMLEGNNNIVTLYDISAMAFHSILDYLYTSEIELTDENVQDVLEAAVYLQIPHIIDMCTEYLEKHLNAENYAGIVKIAKTLALRELEITVYNYICDNLSVLAKLDQFRYLSADHIENILKFDIPVDCTEADLLHFILKWFFNNNVSKFSISKRIQCLPTILKEIKYERISQSAIDDILKKLCADYCGPSHNLCLYNAVFNYIRGIPQIGTNLSCSTFNCRGMKAALLKIGGIGRLGITNEINFCFYNTRQWNYLTKIPHVDQSNFATAVLNNNLYVIGGCYNQQLEEIVHPYGFKYDPRLDVWTEVAAMKTDRCRFTLNACDGKLYAVGGIVDFIYVGQYTNTCERLDPSTNTWEFIDPLPVCRSQHAAVSLIVNGKNRLYVSGGIDGEDVLNSMFYFDNKKQKWMLCSSLLTPRADHFMFGFQEKIYVCGGWDTNSIYRSVRQLSIDVYDCRSNTWEMITKIPVERVHAAITAHDDKIYIVGGYTECELSNKYFSGIQCYDISTNKWTCDNENVQEYWEHSCVTLYIPKNINSCKNS